MARMRTVHPELFTDDVFVRLSYAAQIFFVGLWTQCDDNGVFEWNPVKLKMSVWPASTDPVDPILAELQDRQRIVMYAVDGREYGAVRNFRVYQKPRFPTVKHPIPDDIGKFVGSRDDTTVKDDDQGGGVRTESRGEEGRGGKKKKSSSQSRSLVF